MTDKRRLNRFSLAACLLRQTVGLACLVTELGGTRVSAEDWPTYRHDMARSGITAEKLSPPLQECWVLKSRHAPRPAWGDPKPEPVEGYLELRRMHFDDVFQPVVAGGAVYFGSSADNKVYCLDAATGAIRWTKITGGPVRLAPTVAGGRVLVGSDDGYASCLRAEDGAELWKFRAAPEDRRVLGHGKMISMWPLRTGVLVDGEVAYFSAGIFPAEGVFLYAVDVADGREIWRNDSCGEVPQSPVSPQGYLLASRSSLYVPMGRVSPARFDRSDGRLMRDSPFFGKSVGGSYALLAGEDVYTGTEDMVGYRGETHDRFATFSGRRAVVTRRVAYVAGETELSALDRKAFPVASGKLASLRAQKEQVDTKLRSQSGPELKAKAAELADQVKKAEEEFAATVLWKIPCRCNESLVLAGDVLYAGGADQVIAIDAASGKQIWSGKVEGTAKGLAVAAGRLLASTDQGMIYSFGPEGSPNSGLIAEKTEEDPFGDSPGATMFRQAAETILEETDVDRGYCLVLGVESGQLALELAKRSQLTIYAVSPEADKVAAARKALDAAGLYGARVCVEQWPLEKVPYADYFANLIVSETAMVTGDPPGDPGELVRMLKPLGGTAMLGRPAGPPAGEKPLSAAAIAKWLEAALPSVGDKRSPTDGWEAVEALRLPEQSGSWLKIIRGSLPGAGSWTHQYANPGNTACGDDQRVRAPLGVLWFGHPGPGDMMNRHTRAAGPLSLDGRLFIEGENTVMAYDAYNGLKLWQRDVPGAIRPRASHDSSNLALGPDGLFVAVGDKCLRLDPTTGQTKTTYSLPPVGEGGPTVPAADRGWGYVARVGKLLVGGGGTRSYNSDTVFAVDVETGKHVWIYEGKQIPNNSIAIGDGKLFLVSSDASAGQRQQAIEDGRAEIKGLPESQRAKAERALPEADVRRVVALDLETGRTRWEKGLDLTNCGGWHAATNSYGAILATMYNQGVLVFFGVYLDGHYWQQFFAGQFDTRQVKALSGEDGKLLWSRQIGFRVRPLVIGDTLHAEPWAFDLHTGEPRTRVHPVTGQTGRWQFSRPGHHCGLPIASPNCMFFRSYNLGYYDLVGDYGTMHFGAHRAGCWINFIPAGGLLLVPEASAGCMCAFPNMCTVVFQPKQQNKAWATYSADGPMTPVRRLAINLGAAGDRNDSGGGLWLGYPRPFQGRLSVPLEIQPTFYPGGRFVSGNSVYAPFTGTDDPWLFASAALGLQKCEIPLLGKGNAGALYRVRLALADPENDQPGQRAFDIKLQGKLVEEGFDIVKAAGGRNRAVFREFDGVEVSDKLLIELVPKADKPTPRQLPILQGIEIVCHEKAPGGTR